MDIKEDAPGQPTLLSTLLNSMSISELKEMCKQSRLVNYSSLKKAELVTLLSTKDNVKEDQSIGSQIEITPTSQPTTKVKKIKKEKTTLEQPVVDKLTQLQLEKQRLDELMKKLYIEEQLEKERIESERLEKERLEKEKLEKEKLESERLEKERLEKEKLEKEKLESERLEKERLEKEKLEKEKLESERLEKERLEKEKLEKEKLEQDDEDQPLSVSTPSLLKSGKKKIPKSVRSHVWNLYIGPQINEHRCLCCKKSLIKITEFETGHVVSEKDGGTLEITNLRPICAVCNHSMGTMNMIEFVKKYGYYI